MNGISKRRRGDGGVGDRAKFLMFFGILIFVCGMFLKSEAESILKESVEDEDIENMERAIDYSYWSSILIIAGIVSSLLGFLFWKVESDEDDYEDDEGMEKEGKDKEVGPEEGPEEEERMPKESKGDG